MEEERPPVPMSDRVKAINSVLDFLHDEEGMEQVETQLRITWLHSAAYEVQADQNHRVSIITPLRFKLKIRFADLSWN